MAVLPSGHHLKFQPTVAVMVAVTLLRTVVVNKKLTYRNSNYSVIMLGYGIPYIILHTDVVHEIGCQL